MSNLHIVATPIGNLEDISFRAVRILKQVDLILCEDTRQTRKLLDHYNIKTPTLSYHQHSQLKKTNYIIELLKEGKNLALVSDAGTPGVSDPGNKLIGLLVDKFVSQKDQNLTTYKLKNLPTIIPVPGSCALITAASISGFPTDKFLFLGFLPKKGRKKALDEIVESKYTIIFYESPHRIVKTLEELTLLLGQRKIVLTRELTKKFETIYRGIAKDVLDQLIKDKVKGEFTVVVERKL